MSPDFGQTVIGVARHRRHWTSLNSGESSYQVREIPLRVRCESPYRKAFVRERVDALVFQVQQIRTDVLNQA
jgi:hypothetical protein